MRHVALLRGINVGGKATIPMEELKELCVEQGCDNIRTYLRTGNVRFDTNKKANSLEASLEQAITERFNLSIPVIVRPIAQLSALIEKVPFSHEARTDPSHLLMYLSKSPPKTSALEDLLSKATAGESMRQQGEALWIYFPNGIARSKLTPKAIDRAVGSPATGRNWNTATKLLEL